MKLRRQTATAVATTFVLGFAVLPLVGQDVALRFQWTEGEALTYRTVQESNIFMSGMPGVGDMTITNKMTQVQRLTAESVADDGAATVRAQFDSVKMDMVTPQGTMSFDSASEAPPTGDPAIAQLAQIMGALIGEAVTIVLEPTGRVRSVTGMTAISQKLLGDNPQLAAAMSQLGVDQMMSDDGMEAAFRQNFAFLPAGATPVGGTWETEITVPNPMGTMTVSNAMTLKGVGTVDGRDVARIGIAQAIAVAPGGMMGPMSVEIYDAWGEGEVLFDRQRGQIVQFSNHTTLPMVMTLAAPDGTSITLDAVTNVMTTMELVAPEGR